ncbi:hypothetical protein EYF70_04540 [Pseudoduganella albidiflava]|uniref:Uncharacterized protein n=1 Tax=Pseudoduganella albidiflava TaxID=321983 RepID=A0ABX5RQN2_9BURK|nr:hypothetical protein EYF70_04540 [Pseudoduganella albidiflava]
MPRGQSRRSRPRLRKIPRTRRMQTSRARRTAPPVPVKHLPPMPRRQRPRHGHPVKASKPTRLPWRIRLPACWPCWQPTAS